MSASQPTLIDPLVLRDKILAGFVVRPLRAISSGISSLKTHSLMASIRQDDLPMPSPTYSFFSLNIGKLPWPSDVKVKLSRQIFSSMMRFNALEILTSPYSFSQRSGSSAPVKSQ